MDQEQYKQNTLTFFTRVYNDLVNPPWLVSLASSLLSQNWATSPNFPPIHYSDVMVGAMTSQFTSLSIVYSTVYSGADKKTSKLRVTGLCVGNSPVTGEFPAQMASNAEIFSIW